MVYEVRAVWYDSGNITIRLSRQPEWLMESTERDQSAMGVFLWIIHNTLIHTHDLSILSTKLYMYMHTVHTIYIQTFMLIFLSWLYK